MKIVEWKGGIKSVLRHSLDMLAYALEFVFQEVTTINMETKKKEVVMNKAVDFDDPIYINFHLVKRSKRVYYLPDMPSCAKAFPISISNRINAGAETYTEIYSCNKEGIVREIEHSVITNMPLYEVYYV